jgi:magnesium transporter
MIRAQFSQNGSPPELNLPEEHYPAALDEPNGLLWSDFQAEPAQTSQIILQDSFHFHPLSIDDAIYQTHIPKVDDWDNYLYIALHALKYAPESAEIEMIELDVFLGFNYLVTHHDLPVPALERVWKAFQQDERYRRQGADHLLYVLLDELTVDFMRAVEEIDEEIDVVEDQVFDNPDSKIVQRIFNLKRTTLHLRRSLSPMREVLNKLARDDFSVIDKKDRIYFRDVYDHFVRLHDIAESLRDLVSGVLDTYLSVVNNRMNEVMKTLTLITTLFMPISFVAGFFGMNFFQPVSSGLKGWTSSPAFILSMILLLLTPALMYLWMRRRGWM